MVCEMQCFKLENGIKLIYEHRGGNITSFCIGFNAGALDETGRFSFGTAHALEHMISKGTVKRSEYEINRIFDSIFGFENAMTNYPYTIYYGSCLDEDSEKAIEIYSDILLNPLFSESGFEDEINIIAQELREWRGDPYQLCEDTLFMNSFRKRRIREPIIGSEKSIKSITLDQIYEFYKCFYKPDNCVISFCSPLDFKTLIKIVEDYFGNFENSNEFSENRNYIKEKNLPGLYEEKSEGLSGAKIQYIFDISNLNFREFKTLRLFNCAFGEGTSSMLFDEIRTKNAAAYEIGSHIKSESGIGLLSINMGTSVERVHQSIESIDSVIERTTDDKSLFNENIINDLARRIKIKRELKLERSIQLCKELTTYELIYGNCEKLYKEVKDLGNISKEEIYRTVNKVMNNPSIQVLV